MNSPPIWRHQLTRDAEVSTIAFGGELDLACVASMQALLFEQVQAGDVAEVRVDLAEVAFLDSSALGVLVATFNHARDEGCGFAIIDPSPPARHVLALTGLAEILIED